MRDIETRADITIIVHEFYEKVRMDNMLGPIFNSQIKDWEFHLNRIINFWDQILFNTRKYVGNPMDTHVKVDEHAQYSIAPIHFGKWLELWFNTIDQKYIGENADIIKNQARKMQTVLYMRMWQNKPENKQQ